VRAAAASRRRPPTLTAQNITFPKKTPAPLPPKQNNRSAAPPPRPPSPLSLFLYHSGRGHSAVFVHTSIPPRLVTPSLCCRPAPLSIPDRRRRPKNKRSKKKAWALIAISPSPSSSTVSRIRQVSQTDLVARALTRPSRVVRPSNPPLPRAGRSVFKIRRLPAPQRKIRRPRSISKHKKFNKIFYPRVRSVSFRATPPPPPPPLFECATSARLEISASHGCDSVA